MGAEEFRPNPYIVARFFERLQHGRLKRTQLQMATGLKWSDFSRYLTLLLDLELLELDEENDEIYVNISIKGRDLYHSLIQVLSDLRGLEGC